MSLAIGGSPASAPAHGSQWVDVRTFGAIGDGQTDSTAAFQAGVDHLIATGGGTLFVPSAPANYLVKKSIWVDASNIQIVGEGVSSSILMDNYCRQPVFIFGVQRVQSHVVNGVTISQTVDATYRPDLFGKLDTSVVQSSGQMWGYRSNGDSFVQFQAGPMSSGQGSAQSLGSSDNWSETNKLTIDFCIEPPDGQQFTGTPSLFGIGVPGTDPAPFTIMMSDPNTVRVYFRTSDFDQGSLLGATTPRYRGFDFSIAGADLPYRIAIQFDHVNAVCSAFVQSGGVRTQVALINPVNMTTNSGMYPYTPNSGLTFILNDHYPFMLGTSGISGNYGAPTGVDLRVYGLRMSNTLRYQTNGPGTPQVRTDAPGTPVNDSWAYFGSDANTICYLMGQDNPATSGRALTVSNGGATSGGYTTGMIQHILGNQTFCVGNAIRNIWVQGLGNYGQVISLGSLFEFTAENVKATGGFHGIGTFNIQSSYTIYLRNCTLDGTDAPYYGFMQLIDAREISFATSGRVTIRTVGCGDDWYNIFVAGVSPNVECFYKARGFGYGGAKSITNMLIDFEGYTISRAGIYCEMHGYVPMTSLVLKNIYFGTVGSTISLVQVKDCDYPHPGYSNPCYLSIENLSPYADNYGAAIDVDGPLWYGNVDAMGVRGKPFVNHQKWGTKTNVVMRDPKFTAPPNMFSWYAGAHVLEVRSPVDGQFSEWRCVQSGTYGSSIPPIWLGLNPINISPSGLAAYVLNHVYATATFS